MTPFVQWCIEQGIQSAVAIGTITVAWLALRKPSIGRLEAGLLDEGGELTRIGSTPATFFHVRVTKTLRSKPIHDVRVVLLRILDNENSERSWRGPAPMAWRHGEHWPMVRTVGPAADADLLMICNQELVLLPVFRSNSGTFVFSPPVDLTLFLQAQGIEGDSDYLRIRVVWTAPSPPNVWSEPVSELDRRQHIEGGPPSVSERRRPAHSG